MAWYNSKGVKLASELYNEILKLVNSESPTLVFQHHQHLPHPPDALVLPPLAISIQKIEHDGRNYTAFSSHSGNSSISYRCTNGDMDTGFITSIWSQVLQGTKQIFIVVSPHTLLSAHDAVRSPYSSRTGFLGTVVYSQPTQARSQVLIQQNQIQGHVAFYNRPPGTFGIKAGICILINSLHRQGGPKNRNIYLGSNFFLRPPRPDLTTYIIRHMSIYGNAPLATCTLGSPARFTGLTNPVSWCYL